jgi:ribosomal protein S6
MKKYEGMFILSTAGKEEGIKDVIDKISSEITAAGGRVETVQKMDKRNFTRVADRKYSSGFYVNFILKSNRAR